VQGDGVDGVLRDARPHTQETPESHDCGKHDALMYELLDFVQQSLALTAVRFYLLLFEQLVDVGIAAIG
jgi:hypothetical protein